MFKKVVESERAELESKSIQYLRALADAIGVDSPTLMGKEDLIDEILVVLMGGNSEKKKETRGRPKKNGRKSVFGVAPRTAGEEVVIEYDNIMPKGLGSGLFASNKYEGENDSAASEYDRYISFYQEKIDEREGHNISSAVLSEIGLTEEDVKKIISGDVEDLMDNNEGDVLYGQVLHENGRFYIRGSEFGLRQGLEITDDVVQNGYDLRTGDEVHFYLKDSRAIILLCNQVDIHDMGIRPSFESMKLEKPMRLMSSINLINKTAPIAFGSRNLLCGCLEGANVIAGKVLKKIAKDKKLYVYAVCIEATKEELKLLKSSTDAVLNLSLNGDLRVENEMRVQFLERIKRLVELGKDVVIYLNKVSLVDELNSIVELGGNYSEAGSVTIIGVGACDGVQNMDSRFTNLMFVEQGDGCMPYVNPMKSKTLFMENFLSAEVVDEVHSIKENFENYSPEEIINLISDYE